MPSHPSTEPPPNDSEKARRLAGLALNAVLIALALWVLRDFIAPMVWAGVIVIALWPLLLRLSDPRHGRSGATAIAFAVTLVVGIFVALPFVFVFAQTVHEAHDFAAWLKATEESGIALPEFVTRLPF